jgi:hypothetical protein
MRASILQHLYINQGVFRMKRFLSAGFAVAVTLGSFGFAAAHNAKMGAMDSMKSMSGMAMGGGKTFKISSQNGSGESGTATLTQSGGSLTVKLSLTGSSGEQPAHIHKGTCAKLDPKPAYPLTTVSDGKSETTIKDLKLSKLLAGSYAINVHKSTTDIKDYVACGDLTVANAK